jgi:hypothetical protein
MWLLILLIGFLFGWCLRDQMKGGYQSPVDLAEAQQERFGRVVESLNPPDIAPPRPDPSICATESKRQDNWVGVPKLYGVTSVGENICIERDPSTIIDPDDDEGFACAVTR